MYTDEDLDSAVKQGVLSSQSVTAFRDFIAASRKTAVVDEENFRLVGGFNDIFVVIACGLLLFSSLWVWQLVNPTVAHLVFVALAWWLGEVFILKRKMALPAIFLLLNFVGGSFMLSQTIFAGQQFAEVVSTSVALAAAYGHWRRFNVPMTIAVATAAAMAIVASAIVAFLPEDGVAVMSALFVFGILCFAFAMYWDAQDTQRITRKSDVAFWLHMLSAPLIIHPVFSTLGILNGNESISNMVFIVLLYSLMTLVSITVDRRAFMVSSLFYVIYALQELFGNFGNVADSIAMTGMVMGSILLLLSVYWQTSRRFIVSHLPSTLSQYLPAVKPQ
ncbi:hypothetical protein [Marinomonas posidonica]|uniref:DUF2157 domain-containing protein n=1 Tax=Marinomonas posidonica (strain CECT 7376 / NCIMB 14433 / IVIA-Po-181) TaxID=491952 RepID=F6CUR7_MARPP|nr:hypothetical protein [Marinomonas posidonica]AEF54177.1 hypothetical protein Mar181_1129 [Marinomonas posidonica IVIA-Po-181]